MAELVDALVSGTSNSNVVQVRFLSWARRENEGREGEEREDEGRECEERVCEWREREGGGVFLYRVALFVD